MAGKARVSGRSAARLQIAGEKARQAASVKPQSGFKTSDSFQNFSQKVGLGTGNVSDGGTYGFHPVSRERTLLEWMHRGSWLAGLAVDLVPDDMTRAGVEITGGMSPDDQERIEELATELAIWSAIRDNECWARLYGGSLAVHMVKGQDYSTPFRVDAVGRGQYKGLLVLDRWMVDAAIENLVTDEGPSMGLPKFYRVTENAPGLRGERVHYTRCGRSEGNRLPYWQRFAENGWGESILERLYDRIVAFDSTTQGGAQLVYKAWLRTIKVKGLREAILAGGDSLNGVAQAVNMMARFQSSEGITLLDTEDEYEATSQTAFAGLADFLIHLGQQCSGGMQIPLVRLFGQSPAGLNSTGDSDIRTYYENVNNQQNKKYKVFVTEVYRCLAQSLGIKVDKGFGIKFRPLWLLEESAKADIASKIQTTVTGYVEGGLMTPKAGMMEVRQSAYVTGLGSNITDEDIENASDVLPPVPEVAERPSEGGDKIPEAEG